MKHQTIAALFMAFTVSACATRQKETTLQIVEKPIITVAKCSVTIDRPAFPKVSDGTNDEERYNKLDARDTMQAAYIESLEESFKACGGLVNVR